ncbi:hypothetical protein EK21DRAFT_96390 [Setomelanomma holmii]|uniref:FAD dependent oxidoreductase n=1 Tax=Setomelanomma holmii TaxID=210430 RepID=A0A9P4HMM1_9PLEO|nr:hypothetical protein EK21DRAFT_96390 [Setomelanomma holmii]
MERTTLCTAASTQLQQLISPPIAGFCTLTCWGIGSRNPTQRKSNKVVLRDVAIIGGGAAGTFAAVRLREDYNTSIVLIEPKSHLGGHVSTYLVPQTNTTLQFGVQSYVQNDAALNLFARFAISTQPFASKRLTPLNVDVATGLQLKDYYEPFLEPGYWDFPQPADILGDFLAPFEDFAKDNQLEAAVPRIIAISDVGYGGIRDLLTLHIFQAFGATLTRQVLNNNFFPRLDVLLSSSVQSAKRSESGIEIVVQQGEEDYISKAKRVLFTAPPSLNALSPHEHTCIPENISVNYIPSTAVPSNQLALKDWPYQLRLDSTGPSGLGLFRVVFGANYTMSTDEFKDIVTKSVRKLQEAGTLQGNCSVDFKASSDHTRPQWKLTAQQLKDGFVQDLYALHRYRSTWYTGYAWGGRHTAVLCGRIRT